MLYLNTVVRWAADSLSSTFLLTGCLAFFLILFLYSNTHYLGAWQRLGVPGPKPWPFLENRPELRNGLTPAFKKWFQQYGNTVGVYGIIPQRPSFLTKDLNILRQIMVKDFDSFEGRCLLQPTAPIFRKGVIAATGDDWRRYRHLQSPMFTGSKLRMMLTHVSTSAKSLRDLVKDTAKNNDLIPLKRFASKYSTDVIARICFGIHAPSISREETQFEKECANLIQPRNSIAVKIANFLYNLFPPVHSIASFIGIKLYPANSKAISFFVHSLQSTIASRKLENARDSKPRDLLDLLLKAVVDENDPQLPTSTDITREELISNIMNLLFAGVETVSASFQSIVYCLALYPNFQEKVIDEIDRLVPVNEDLTYENVSQLKYTDQFINECLRLMPLIESFGRLANATKTYGSFTIPKGWNVQIPIKAILHDPDHWPEPDRFDPDRFSPENTAARDPMAFIPFGYGPRVCIGQRLALLQLKIAIVELLRQVRFGLSDRTEPKQGEKIAMGSSMNRFSRPLKPVELEAEIWDQ